MSMPITPPGGPPANDDAKRAASQLEAYFLRTLMKEVHAGDNAESISGGGFAGQTFHEMLDGALADSMAKAGGIGLAKVLQPQLERAGSPSAPSMQDTPDTQDLPALKYSR